MLYEKGKCLRVKHGNRYRSESTLWRSVEVQSEWTHRQRLLKPGNSLIFIQIRIISSRWNRLNGNEGELTIVLAVLLSTILASSICIKTRDEDNQSKSRSRTRKAETPVFVLPLHNSSVFMVLLAFILLLAIGSAQCKRKTQTS